MKKISEKLGHLMTEEQKQKNQLELVESKKLDTIKKQQELVFVHSILCQTFIPYRRPLDENKQDLDFWEKKQGRASLLIEAGRVMDRHTGKQKKANLPYGSVARLLLTHLNTEAITSHDSATRNEGIIPLGKNIRELAAAINKNGTDTRVRKSIDAQLHNLMGCRIKFGFSEEYGHATRIAGASFDIISQYDLWYSKDEAQQFLFPSFVKLGYEYFQNLKAHSVPLDKKSLYALSKSPLAMDVYCWLAYRLHRIPFGKRQFIGWKNLYDQFGEEYGRFYDFKVKFRKALKFVLSEYPEAKILEEKDKGFHLANSPTPVVSTTYPLSNLIK